jgi:hypothetical protein
MYPMLDTLPSLSHAHLPKFLIILTPLTTSHPQLFSPHLHALLSFLPALIIPSADSGPTPTVARPFPGAQSFTFPPTPNGGPVDDEELDEEAEEVRKAALEFMISLSEAKPAMVRRTDGWVSAIVRGCLGGMGEMRDDELASWLDADVRVFPSCPRECIYMLILQPAEDPTDDTYPHVYEQSLDRLACAVGGKAVLPAAFQHIPGMLASHDWKLRHAGLMAIASVAEGTSKVMQNELGKVVEYVSRVIFRYFRVDRHVSLITPLFLDPYPRVRYAACQCMSVFSCSSYRSDTHWFSAEGSYARISMKSFKRNTTSKSSPCSFPHSKSLNPGLVLVYSTALVP